MKILLPITYYLLPYLLPTTYYQLPTIYYQVSTYYLLPTTYYLLLATYCLAIIDYYLLLTLLPLLPLPLPQQRLLVFGTPQEWRELRLATSKGEPPRCCTHMRQAGHASVAPHLLVFKSTNHIDVVDIW